MRVEGESFTVADPASGHVVYSKKASPSKKPKKPEIMRHDLRMILLDSLEQNSVRWGSRCAKVEATSDGKYDIRLEEGVVETGFDLVVGADGAWSKVRPLVTSQEPFYSGVNWMQIVTPAGRVRSDIDKLVGPGAMIASRDRRTIWAERHSDGSVQAGLYLRASENWYKDVGIDWTNVPQASKAIADKYLKDADGWAEPFRQMFLGGKDLLLAKPLYMLPVGMNWKGRKG
jgi:hypothetical protein